MRVVVPVISAALITIIGLFVGGEFTAWRFGWSPELGQPITVVSHLIPIYAPWSLIEWWIAWGNDRHIINGLVIAAAISAAAIATALAGQLSTNHKEFGRKEWGTLRDAIRAKLLTRGSNGIVIAKLRNKLLTFCGDQHTLFAGGSGSGKSAGPVISSLLWTRDSVLVFDPKAELYEATARFRSTIGPTLFFDPTSAQSACFNPLDEIPVETDREIAAVQNLVQILLDSSSLKGRSSPFWPISAGGLLTAVVLYAVRIPDRSKRHLGTVRRLLADMKPTMAALEACPVDECRIAAAKLLPLTGEVADNIAATAQATLEVFADPLVVAKTSRSDFRISDLACGLHPMSLYLQVPPSDRDRIMPLFRMIIMQFSKSFLHRPAVCSDGREKLHRVRLIADEFPAAGKLPGFAQDLQEFRGCGVTCMLMCQSLKNLADVYGETQAIRDNCHIVTCFASSDPDSMRDISTALGEGVEFKTSTSHKRWEWMDARVSTSTQRRPLMAAGDVRMLGFNETLIMVTGIKPIRAKKVYWFREPFFRRRGTNTRNEQKSPAQHRLILERQGV